MSKQVGQKGFTVLELVVGIAITGLVVCGALGLIFHEFKGTATAKTYVTAAQELGTAARAISQDAMMADTSSLADGGSVADQLTLTWTERFDFMNIPHSSTYALYGNELRRNYDGTSRIIARNITGMAFSKADNLIKVTLSCTLSGLYPKTIEKTYLIYLRPTEEVVTQ